MDSLLRVTWTITLVPIVVPYLPFDETSLNDVLLLFFYSHFALSFW